MSQRKIATMFWKSTENDAQSYSVNFPDLLTPQLISVMWTTIPIWRASMMDTCGNLERCARTRRNKSGRVPVSRRLAANFIALLLLDPGIAFAQRAEENAITESQDAFGTTIGGESTGIYSSNDTRGFSPRKAGNSRIDGIYYDPVGDLWNRLRHTVSIRVGFAAMDHPFQAPTGIVDTRLKPYPEEPGASFSHTLTAYPSLGPGSFGELDVRLPIGDHLGVNAGYTWLLVNNTDGSGNFMHGVTVRPIIRSERFEFGPFIHRSQIEDDLKHPLVVVKDRLPEFPKRGRFLGQKWATGSYSNNHLGATLKAQLKDRLALSSGLFYSNGDIDESYSEIFSLVTPAGLSNHALIADPPRRARSTSGEALFERQLGDGRWQHRLIFGFRGRSRLTEFGGSDIFDFGQVNFGQENKRAIPDFAYSEVNSGKVRQSNGMLGYIGTRDGLGSINLGIQKSHYRASSKDGRSGIRTTSLTDSWLYNATLAIDLNQSLSIYFGTQRGLEDSGNAPENAANRSAQLPATSSTQYEGGVRWKFPTGQAVINTFHIRKPYFSFDAANVFSELGKVEHRGVEASLFGQFGKRLNLVSGVVVMQPRVSGPLRDSDVIGELPAGTPSIFARIDANYRTDILDGLMTTATLSYTGKRAVGSRPLAEFGGKQLMVPSAAIVDLGVRYSFKVGRIPVSIRAVVNNALDKKTWRVVAANTIFVDERRRFSFALVADY